MASMGRKFATQRNPPSTTSENHEQWTILTATAQKQSCVLHHFRFAFVGVTLISSTRLRSRLKCSQHYFVRTCQKERLLEVSVLQRRANIEAKPWSWCRELYVGHKGREPGGGFKSTADHHMADFSNTMMLLVNDWLFIPIRWSCRR